MNNYNLHQTGNNHYCDCCLKDIDIDNDNYVIGKEQNKGFIFCSEKCNTKEETKIMETYNIIGIKIDSEKEEILEGNISCIRKAKYLLNEYQKNYGVRWKVILNITKPNK